MSPRFPALDAACRARIRTLVLQRGLPPADAEDVTQNVLLAIARGAPEVPEGRSPEEAFQAWCFGIVQRQVASYRRETSGNRSHATSGNRSHETSGNRSHETSGNRSRETSGNRSHETSGNRSHETSGNRSHETSGNRSHARRKQSLELASAHPSSPQPLPSSPRASFAPPSSFPPPSSFASPSPSSPASPAESGLFAIDTDVDELASPSPGPDELLAAAADITLARRMLEELRSTQEARHAVLVAYEMEERSMAEIAATLGVSVNTCWNRLRLAREDARALWHRLSARSDRRCPPVARAARVTPASPGRSPRSS